MHCLLSLILSIWISKDQFAVGLIDVKSISADLESVNQSCNADKCSLRSEQPPLTYGCHCHKNCVQFDSCCLDSRYIQAARPKLKPTCRIIKDMGMCYYMVDRCPTSDSVWENLCRDELSSDDDILKLVPVTSLLTSITYKNYFCFRCHETSDEFFYWKVKFERKFYEGGMPSKHIMFDIKKRRYSLRNYNGTWIASIRNGLVRWSLRLSVEIPKDITHLVTPCVPNIISACANEWTHSEMIEKCHAYMGIREVQRDNVIYRYKNLHCALCNFEDLNDIICRTHYVDGYGSNDTFDPRVVFSFTHLLDINTVDGDRVGKVKKCDDEHTWDPFTGKCRKLTCALSGYKIQNGKCESR